MIIKKLLLLFSINEHLYFKNDKNPDNYYTLLHYCTILGFLYHILFLILFAVTGFTTLSVLNVFSALTWAFSFYLTQIDYKKTSQILLTIEILVHSLLTTITLGWYSGFHYYIICIICFSFFTPHWRKLIQIFTNILLAFLYYCLSMYMNSTVPIYTYDISILYLFNFINLVGTILLLVSNTYIYRYLENEYGKKLGNMNELLSVMAITDPLTSLYNRRGILNLANDKLIPQEKYVIALCDIDDFKIFNESYGHRCGDYVLKGVSDVISSNVGELGIVGRWGGEEFLIILTKCNISIGKILIENTQKNIETSHFHYNSQTLSVTMTFGYTVFDYSESLSEAINRADRALRYGKTQGKNCAVEE